MSAEYHLETTRKVWNMDKCFAKDSSWAIGLTPLWTPWSYCDLWSDFHGVCTWKCRKYHVHISRCPHANSQSCGCPWQGRLLSSWAHLCIHMHACNGQYSVCVLMWPCNVKKSRSLMVCRVVTVPEGSLEKQCWSERKRQRHFVVSLIIQCPQTPEQTLAAVFNSPLHWGKCGGGFSEINGVNSGCALA